MRQMMPHRCDMKNANRSKKISALIQKHRHWFAAAGIVFAAIIAFVFVGIDSLSLAQSKTQRVIVNDDYTVLTQAIADTEGIRQQLQVKKDTTLHGVSVNIATFARVVRGTVYADIYNDQGQLAASASADMVTLKDNTFFAFLFDRPVACAEDTALLLHIYTVPQTDEDRIALWKSETSYDGFSLQENGAAADGTIAIQYTTEHVGRDIVWYYLLFFCLSVLAMLLVYALTFAAKAKIEVLFLAAALLIGGIFAIFTPIGGAPDEYVHIASAYQMSNKILGTEELGPAGTVTVRACDADTAMMNTVKYNGFSFQKIWQGLTDGSPVDETPTVIEARTAAVFPLQYAAQTAGIILARLLHLNFVWLAVLGRLANLLVYTAVGYWAVRIMPVFKTTLALCALLPMSLQLAGSFSYDAYVLHLSLMGIALVFRMAYGTDPIRLYEAAACGAVFALLAPAKAVYILLAMLIFIVPTKRFSNRTKAWLTKGAVFAVALVFWGVTNTGAILGTLGFTYTRAEAKPEISAAGQTVIEPEESESAVTYPYDSMVLPSEESLLYYDPDGDLLPNGDSRFYYSISYMLHNPGQTVRLLVHTLTTESGKFIQSLLGTRLGELIIVDLSASWIWGILLLGLLGCSVLLTPGQEVVHTGLSRLWGAAIFIGIAAATVLACIMWTPINYTYIFGIQGRYFLPAFPLLVMAAQSRVLRLQQNIDRQLVFGIVPVNLLILLNVFLLMAQKG